MDYLAIRFLNGFAMSYKDIRKLYSNYKRYCGIFDIRIVDVYIENDKIEWTLSVPSSSFNMRAYKPVYSNDDKFMAAKVAGKLEYWFYALRTENRVLSNVWLYSIINHENSLSVAERIGILSPRDYEEKKYYIEHSIIPNMIKASGKRILKLLTKTYDKVYNCGRLEFV